MPEMDGQDLAKKITDLYPDILCLYMSGYTAEIIAHHGVLDAGVAFIQKPFSMAAMTEKYGRFWMGWLKRKQKCQRNQQDRKKKYLVVKYCFLRQSSESSQMVDVLELSLHS